MICVKGTENFTTDKDSILTLGKFDGVHRGHQLLIDTVVETARHYGLSSAVLAFTSEGKGVSSNKVIMTDFERRMLMRSFKADVLIECPFTESIRSMESEDFVRDVLLKKLRAKAIVAGKDFRFGRGRTGDVETLKKFGKKYGFDIYIMDKIKDEGREISSTYIRGELEKGNIPKVNELLGYTYFASGCVVRGNQLGRRIGYPTANMIPEAEKLLPPYGVYSTESIVNGESHKSVSNVGIRPTVSGDTRNIESHLLDFDEDIYGELMITRFYEFKRPEKKFGSLEELKEQIKKDTAER